MEAVTDKLGSFGDLGGGRLGLPSPSTAAPTPDAPASPMSPIPLGF